MVPIPSTLSLRKFSRPINSNPWSLWTMRPIKKSYQISDQPNQNNFTNHIILPSMKHFTTNETINDLAKEMISKWFTIISPSDPHTYISFMYQGKFWYVQYGYHQYSWARSYPAQKDFWTGQWVFEWYEITMNEINRILQCRLDIKIKNYTTLESYLDCNNWQDLMITTSESQYIVPKNNPHTYEKTNHIQL